MCIFREKKAKVWDDSTGALWVRAHTVLLVFWIIIIITGVYKPHVRLKRNHFHSRLLFYLTPCSRRGVGGFRFLSSDYKKETWCYAISWCAMFVLYTGSGEMLLLTTDLGMDWLSVVFFSAVFYAMMPWCHDAMAALMMSHYRHSGVDEVIVTTTMNAVGCSYAENFLVNLNNKDKLQFSALALFFCLFVFHLVFFSIFVLQQILSSWYMAHIIN